MADCEYRARDEDAMSSSTLQTNTHTHTRAYHNGVSMRPILVVVNGRLRTLFFFCRIAWHRQRTNL